MYILKFSDLTLFDPNKKTIFRHHKGCVLLPKFDGVFNQFNFVKLFYAPKQQCIVFDFHTNQIQSSLPIRKVKNNTIIHLLKFCLHFDIKIDKHEYEVEKVLVDGLHNAWAMPLKIQKTIRPRIRLQCRKTEYAGLLQSLNNFYLRKPKQKKALIHKKLIDIVQTLSPNTLDQKLKRIHDCMT